MILLTTHVAALALTLSSPVEPALGEEQFGNAAVPVNEEWATGVDRLANDSHRVYRRWVNGNEEFFFKGTTRDLNAALIWFARTAADVHEVHLLPWTGKTASFEGVEVAYDWRLYAPSGICLAMAEDSASPVYPTHAILTIHLTESIWLRRLSIPAGVTLFGPEELATRYRAAGAPAAHALEQLEMQTKPRNEDQARRNEAVNAHIEATRDVDLELSYDHGDKLFHAAIVNRRTTPVTIVLPGDGSHAGARTPSIDWQVLDTKTGDDRTPGWFGCGTFGGIRAEEIVTLAPGERRPITVWGRLPGPGRYLVALRYDNDPARGLLRGQVDSNVLALVRSSERLILTSRAIELVVEESQGH